MDLEYWNKKIYKNEDGSFVCGGLGAEEFWEEFKIKSAPKFKGACWFHIPERWAKEVREFIRAVQEEFGDKVQFAQIKEKFCWLTVYYDCDKETRKRVEELRAECIKKLVEKGVHPGGEE